MFAPAAVSNKAVVSGDIVVAQDGERGLFAVVAGLPLKTAGQFKCWVGACEKPDYGELVKKCLPAWFGANGDNEDWPGMWMPEVRVFNPGSIVELETYEWLTPALRNSLAEKALEYLDAFGDPVPVKAKASEDTPSSEEEKKEKKQKKAKKEAKNEERQNPHLKSFLCKCLVVWCGVV